MTAKELINLINVRYKALMHGKGTADNLIDKYKAITSINFLHESIVIDESMAPDMIEYLYWHIPNGFGMVDDVNGDGTIDEQDEDALDDIFFDADPSARYNFLDILWNDGQITADLREEDAEKDPSLAPVAICVIPTDYLGKGEKARFVSLKYVDSTGAGSLTSVGMPWGPNSISPDPIEDMYTMYICKNVTNPSTNVQGGGNFYWTPNSPNTWPDLRYNEEGTAWQDAQQYLEGDKYVMADIDGIANCKRLHDDFEQCYSGSYVFANISKFNPNPHPEHNINFSWYLPAAGELLNMLFNIGYDKYDSAGPKFKEGSINTRIQDINKVYSGKLVAYVNNAYLWSSTPVSATGAAGFYADASHCYGGNGNRTGNGGYSLAFVQI